MCAQKMPNEDNLKKTIEFMDAMIEKHPELDYIKEICIKDSTKYFNGKVSWWFLDELDIIEENDDICIETNIVGQAAEEPIEFEEIETEVETEVEDFEDFEDKWYSSKSIKKRNKKNKSKPVENKKVNNGERVEQPFIPKLKFISQQNYSKYDIQTVFKNDISDNLFYSLSKDGNEYTICLNLRGDYSINSPGFNLIQGILYSTKHGNKFRIEYKNDFLDISFHDSVNIHHNMMKYYENVQIGLRSIDCL